MPRDIRQGEAAKRAKARRAHALERREIGQPTAPRVSAAGAVSMAIKATDPADRLLIEAFLASKRGGPA